MDDKTLKLLTELHECNKRQGPGSDRTFQRALDLSGIDNDVKLSIADIGCGTGVSTIALAQHTKATVTAVDLLPEFLDKLKQEATKLKLHDRVTVLEADMANLPFQKEQFDVIWSEGAIYNIGFEKGIKLWKDFLKKDGVMVLTEITWLTHEIPKELREHWEQEYPEIAHASKKIQQLENNGFVVKGYFPLGEDAWLNEYYFPLQASFNNFLKKNGNSEEAKKIIEAEENEIELYKKYKKHISYGCYVAQKAN